MDRQMYKVKVKIQDLFEAIEATEKVKLELNHDFILKNSKVNIKDENGNFQQCPAIIKKRDKITEITFTNNIRIRTAANHVFIKNKNTQETIYAKNVKVGDKFTLGNNQEVTVFSVRTVNKKEDVFDLQINTKNHWYQTANGLVHHNTLILAGLLNLVHDCKIICLFDKIDLITQTQENLIRDFGFKNNEIGMVGGGHNEFTKKIVLLSVQSYQNMFTEFPDVGFIIMDEVHSTGRTETAEKILFSCQNAPLRIGLSATASVLENPYEQLKLYANVGPVILKREMREQMDDGILAETKVKMYQIANEPQIPIVGSWGDVYEKREVFQEELKLYQEDTNYEWIIESTTMKISFLEKTENGKTKTKKIDYERLDEYIEQGWQLVKTKPVWIVKRLIQYGDESVLYVRNELRNKAIAVLAKKLKRVLILYSKITHGELLKEYLPDAVLIHGAHDKEEREHAKKILAEKEDAVVLASSIFDVGVDIPSIKNLIIASPNVSNVRVIQKGGRAVRVDKKTNKTTALIHDFYSDANKIASKQSKKRKEIYENIMKLPVEIVDIKVQ